MWGERLWIFSGCCFLMLFFWFKLRWESESFEIDRFYESIFVVNLKCYWDYNVLIDVGDFGVGIFESIVWIMNGIFGVMF